MPEDKDKKDKSEFEPEFDIVEQATDDDSEKPDKVADKTDAPGYEDDERLSASQRDDEDDDQGESQEGADKGLSEKELEARRERRRQERKARKLRQTQNRERDAREMHFLRTRNEQLERQMGAVTQRVSRNEIAQVDGRLEQLKLARDEAEEVLAKAIEANNGADVVKLNRTIRELEGGISRLTNYRAGLEKEHKEDKEGAESGTDTEEKAAPPRRLAPAVIRNVQLFGARHEWFNPQGTDEESRIVQALDSAVLAEGFDPATRDYWEELEDRMARRLPERMKKFGAAKKDDEGQGDDPPQRRVNGSGNGGKPRGGPRMASGSQTRGTGKQFLLSAERKRAMIEAGVWDDPELRDKYIHSYAEWDKANPASGR